MNILHELYFYRGVYNIFWYTENISVFFTPKIGTFKECYVKIEL